MSELVFEGILDLSELRGKGKEGFINKLICWSTKQKKVIGLMFISDKQHIEDGHYTVKTLKRHVSELKKREQDKYQTYWLNRYEMDGTDLTKEQQKRLDDFFESTGVDL